MKKNRGSVLRFALFRCLAVLAVVWPLSTIKAQRVVYHSLEASYVALNVYDLKTTFNVIDKGGYEMNPLMKGTHAHMIAVKSFATLGTLGLLRIIRKDHPKTALISLAVLNVGMGYLVTRNYQISVRITLPSHPSTP